jgi:hypothetical protein
VVAKGQRGHPVVPEDTAAVLESIVLEYIVLGKERNVESISNPNVS